MVQAIVIEEVVNKREGLPLQAREVASFFIGEVERMRVLDY